jgi:hypothetical protein
MMYLWGVMNGGIAERDLNTALPGTYKPDESELSTFFTTVWVLVGPVGGTAIKLPYMAKCPVASIALP